MANQKSCTIDGCGRPHHARGWCGAHYYRWMTHGDPTGGGTSPGELMEWIEAVALPYQGEDCLPWPFGCYADGYGMIKINGKMSRVNRIICSRAHGEPPTPNHVARHLCGRGHLGCSNPSHLAWGTYSQNETDKLLHGTHNRGERHNMAKLTEADVREIRSLAGTIPHQDLASKFGVRAGTVKSIVAGLNWGWLV